MKKDVIFESDDFYEEINRLRDEIKTRKEKTDGKIK